MNKDVINRGLSDNEFLKLFVSISVINGDNIDFENEEMEKDLYRYANSFKYRFLFSDINIDVENKLVCLSHAINYCYTSGILMKDHSMSSYGKRSIMNITKSNAYDIVSKYDKKEVEAMSELCNDYYHADKKSIKIKTKK